MSDNDTELDRKLEYVLIGIWVLVVIAALLLVNHLFLQPIYEAEKRTAQQHFEGVDNRR